MKQLERLKMKHVLQEIEQEEQLQADQKFYGDIAFERWLDSKGLPLKKNDSGKLKRSSQKGMSEPNSKKTQKTQALNKSVVVRKPKITEPIAEESESSRGTPQSGLEHRPMNTYPNKNTASSVSEDDMEAMQVSILECFKI